MNIFLSRSLNVLLAKRWTVLRIPRQAPLYKLHIALRLQPRFYNTEKAEEHESEFWLLVTDDTQVNILSEVEDGLMFSFLVGKSTTWRVTEN